MIWRSSIDQMGNLVELREPPQRIVSLVPSQTELLSDLNLDARVVGITKFCVHPPQWAKSKTIIGGTKNFHVDAIEQLNPDLIIGNKEENDREGISKLQKLFPVWMSDIGTFADALQMIDSISNLTDTVVKGAKVRESIMVAFSELKPLPPTTVLYLMWRNPWMGAANGTFIHEMISMCGLKNVLADQMRYPELSPMAIKALNPGCVMLSSEPYPFDKKHVSEIQELLPQAKIILVDGEMFSWYGSRLVLAPAYFNSLGPRF